MPRTGIEPARLAAHAPETCASTYSATWAFRNCRGKGSEKNATCKRFTKKFLLIQEFELKQQEVDNRYRDIGIGKVKHRAKEIVVVIDQEG